MDNFHSLPNILKSVKQQSSNKDLDPGRQLYSLSLSAIRSHSDFSEHIFKPTPFNIRWIHGYNAKVGVLNLNANGSTIAFYAAGNCAVLFNWTSNQMRILQGHRHTVAFIAADSSGKWLVTADSGPENILIIWDSQDFFPQRTLFSPHRETKLSKVAISADAKYLLTLAYNDGTAAIYWWIWTLPWEEPHGRSYNNRNSTLLQRHARQALKDERENVGRGEAEAHIPRLNVKIPRDAVIAMEFNPHNSEQFALMTKNDLWIGRSGKVFVIERGLLKETDDYELKIRCPEKKIGPDVGKMTCFTFVESTAQILVGTSKGSVIVYGYTIEHRKNVENTNYENLRFIKVLKVEKEKINVIKNVDGLIVTGNNVGEIRFYDDQLKLLYWVHGFTVDSVRGMSFNILPRSYQIFDPKCRKKCPCWEKVVTDIDIETGLSKQKLLKMKIPDDATIAGKPFVVRDFIVCTHKQRVGFVDYVKEEFHPIIDNKPTNALALSVHPEKPFVCIGYADGMVELFNFVQHKLFRRLQLREHYTVVVPPRDDSIRGDYEVSTPALSVTCLEYSPSGLHLACGLNTGELIFLDPITIAILTETPFRDTTYAIKKIEYSCDSLTMAYADAGRTVCVYKYDCGSFSWRFVGKHRAHYKDVTALLFLPHRNDDGEYKLISLGADRIMVEYNIGKSSNEYLDIASLDRVEQTATPLAVIAWPPPRDLDPATHHATLSAVLIANDEHKYKITNYMTTMTLSTVLGPRYERPVSRLRLASAGEGAAQKQYLVFATDNVIGLQKMPLDGNPWKHVGMLGHPLQITGMCYREDKHTLFTIGLKDSCMYQWAANYRSVETTTKRGGGDLDPYYCLVESGRPGWLFQEVRDLFYYIQILCQGTFSPAMRRVKDYIPIDSLPDLMRALGFFPTEYEVENLIAEAKYKVYQREPSTEIDFEEFVKLYLNHRPAFGDNFGRIRSAFHHFAAFERDAYVMTRDDFVDMLSNHGECFTQNLSWYLLSILSGQSFEDRAAMTEGDFSFLPEEITFGDLTATIIGIQDVDNLSEQFSAKDSCVSQQTGSSMDSDEK